MRVKRLTFISGTVLLVWGVIFALYSAGLLTGFATLFLPISLSIFFINELKTVRPPFDLSIIFLGSCIFFFCIALILAPVSSNNPLNFSGLIITTFTIEELDIASTYVGVSVSISFLSLSLFRKPVCNREFQPASSLNARALFRLGKWLTLLSAPVVTYELWSQYLYFQQAGYLTLYVEKLTTSVVTRFFFYLFYLGFGLVVAFSVSRKDFFFPAVIYLIVASLDSLKGVRGAVITPFLFLVWFYFSRFNARIKLASILSVICISAFSFILITYMRQSDESAVGSIAQIVIDTFSSQGRSLQWIALYNEISTEIAEFGNYTVFSNLLMPFQVLLHPELRDAPQSLAHVLYSNNLKHIMTYVLNSPYYFSGGGTGSVYIIELIEAGPILYVLLSIGLGWFLAWLPVAMRYAWVRYLSIYFFSTIFYLPRGEFFFNTLIVGKALLLYLIILFAIRLVKRSPNTSFEVGKAFQSR